MSRVRRNFRLGVRVEPGWSTFASSIGSTVAESVASQSNYSLLTVSGFITGEETVRLGRSEPSMVVNQTQGAQSKGIVTTESEEDNKPLTVLSRNLKLK